VSAVDVPIRVTFLKSGKTVAWDPAAESLLDFAESHGLAPAFSCRAGVCNTCLSIMKSGAVTYAEPPLMEPGLGEVLLCCSKPECSVELDI